MSIKTIRKELGLSQMDFARLFGVHQTAVSQWETGRTSPDTDMAIRIARGTGHSVDEVLGVEMHTGPTSGEHTFEIIMPDDRMAGARIRKGDKVYLREMQDYASDALVGFQKKGVATVRFLKLIGGEKYVIDAQIPPVMEKVEAEDRILGMAYGFYAYLE